MTAVRRAMTTRWKRGVTRQRTDCSPLFDWVFPIALGARKWCLSVTLTFGGPAETKKPSPSLLWGDLAARATLGKAAYDGFLCHFQELSRAQRKFFDNNSLMVPTLPQGLVYQRCITANCRRMMVLASMMPPLAIMAKASARGISTTSISSCSWSSPPPSPNRSSGP